WSVPRLLPSRFNTSRFVFWSAAGFALPPSAPKEIRVKRTLEAVGLVWRDRLYRRSSLAGSRKPFRFAGKKCRRDKDGRGRKLEHHHAHADGRAKANAVDHERGRSPHGHAASRRPLR